MNYNNNEGINQSALKKIGESPKAFLNTKEKNTKSFTIGSIVDIKLLTPERFEKEYFVGEFPNVSEALGKIFKHIEKTYSKDRLRKSLNSNNQDLISAILETVDLFKYREGWNMNSRIEYVLKHIDYLEFLYKAEGKEVISLDDFFKYQEIVTSLEEHPYTKEIFSEDKNKGIECINQKEIYWEHSNVRLKSLLDRIKINHKKKTIQPYDLKTMSGYTHQFIRKNFWKFRYDFQGSFYTEALKFEYPDYTILPFIFVVESTTSPGSPLKYQITNEVLDIGMNGGIVYNKEYKGWKDCLEAYIWHSQNDLWEYTKEEYDNEGLMPIKIE